MSRRAQVFTNQQQEEEGVCTGSNDEGSKGRRLVCLAFPLLRGIQELPPVPLGERESKCGEKGEGFCPIMDTGGQHTDAAVFFCAGIHPPSTILVILRT